MQLLFEIFSIWYVFNETEVISISNFVQCDICSAISTATLHLYVQLMFIKAICTVANN
jgi:hypothetical protein